MHCDLPNMQSDQSVAFSQLYWGCWRATLWRARATLSPKVFTAHLYVLDVVFAQNMRDQSLDWVSFLSRTRKL